MPNSYGQECLFGPPFYLHIRLDSPALGRESEFVKQASPNDLRHLMQIFVIPLTTGSLVPERAGDGVSDRPSCKLKLHRTHNRATDKCLCPQGSTYIKVPLVCEEIELVR